MSHFIPCSKTLSSQETVQLFIQHIFRYHGAPNTIVSDRGPQFIADFWRRFFELIGCTPNLSTAFHPDSDGQNERVNQSLEAYLRCNVNYYQDNWSQLLTFAEVSYNNAVHVSIGCSPFVANFGYNPKFHFLFPDDSVVPAAETMVKDVHEVQETLKELPHNSQLDYKTYADKHRTLSPAFNVGDLVWLNAKNLRTTRPSKKLDFKRVERCRITKVVNEVAF